MDSGGKEVEVLKGSSFPLLQLMVVFFLTGSFFLFSAPALLALALPWRCLKEGWSVFV